MRHITTTPQIDQLIAAGSPVAIALPFNAGNSPGRPSPPAWWQATQSRS